MSYGVNIAELYRRLITYYAAKILQGTAPGDLPIERPTKFELVVVIE